MVTFKILNPRKIEENKTESRSIALEADILINYKFPYNFFFTTRLTVHSEPLTALQDRSSLKLILLGGVSIWMGEQKIYHFVTET